MKGSRLFVLFVVLFLVVIFAVEYRLPKQFVWTPTFGHYDKQPFGCAVFDSVLASSLPSGYALSKKTFYQLEQQDTVNRQGILLVGDPLNLANVDVDALLRMAGRGNKIMLVSSSFPQSLTDTLKFDCTYSRFSPVALKKYAASFFKKDSISWIGNPAVYSRQTFCFYPQLCQSYFRDYDSLPIRKLAEKDINDDMEDTFADTDSVKTYSIENPLIAFTRPWGKGEIVLISTPLLFTNYGVLDGKNAAYIFRLLSQMGELPILRTEGYMKDTAQEQQSPFRFFLSQRPLRWALYLTMITVLLFMVFTARRRQRAIPVVREPENKSLEFTKLIGTLYFQKKDHADLVRKKFLYFAEVLRREIQVDIEEVADDERTFQRIALKTGMDSEEISRFIREVRPIIYGGREIDDREMKRVIDKINEIINYI